jgi:hypothetical protein
VQSVEAVLGKGSVMTANGQSIFQNRTYVCRLRLQTLQATHSVVEEPCPSLDELLLFHQSGWDAVASSVKEVMHRGSIRNAWQAGDRVNVVCGELAGLWGEIKSLNFELWSAEIALLTDGVNSIQQVPLDSLVRHISVGANVVVVAGSSKE